MPYFVLNRNYVLQGHGHAISFIKGESCWVPAVLVTQAAAIGAECLDEEVNVLGPEPVVVPELSSEERAVLISAAIEQIIARAEPGKFREDFNAQGLPNIKALAEIVGFTPETKERNKLWQKYREGVAG